MKIVHLMLNEKFTKSIANFYDNYRNKLEHTICYLNTEGESSIINWEMTIKQKEFFLPKNGFNLSSLKVYSDIIHFIRQYDFVVLHSYYQTGIFRLLLFLKNNLLKRIVWIEWGADLYSWRKKELCLRDKIINRINMKIRSKVYGVVCIFPPDMDYYRKEFPNSKAKVYYAPYCGASVTEEFMHYSSESRLALTNSTDDTVYIQVGHNAMTSLNHLEVLETLSKFKDDNIKILLPLSYPKAAIDYIEIVEKRARELFPDKVIVLKDFMSSNEYFELIKRVDIAIFDTYRQTALGNINRMIFRNVKLYMPKESVMYKYFAEQGVPVQQFENIFSETFEQFKMPVQASDMEKFKNHIDKYTNMERKIKYWDDIYEELRKRKK